MEKSPMELCGRLDERRSKINELIKERMKTADNILLDKQKKTGIEKRLEESDQQLKDLIEFGDELVTNIKVAGEMREIQRRNFEEAQKKALLGDLSKESTEAIAKFNSITDKWSELKNFKEPMALFNQLEKQKERISELMARKDEIIDKCQAEIDRVNDKYYADQEKQAAEISSLVERIDSQVELIKQAYKNHLILLQDAIEEERLKMAETESERWEGLFEAMKANEKRKVEVEKEKEKFYINEIHKIFREQQEITRATRIRLERDAEALELELRNTQNNILMNSEKLDYNYQVLQKRNEENVIINNQQKRRVARFKETISGLKAKILAIREKAQGAVKKMSVDVEKLFANISELEKKSQQFLIANEKKYRYVWNINYQEALTLTHRIFEIDRLLHEQQLGVTWIPQQVKGITYNPLDNTTTGRKLMSLTVKSPENEEEVNKKISSAAVEKTAAEQLAETRLLRSILKKISDRGGFLIEEKLLEILEPYSEEERCLVRIDNIFNALRITEKTDITSLTKYFLPYSWCPNCSSGILTDVIDELRIVVDIHSRRGRPSLAEELEKVAEDTVSLTISDICSVSTDDVERNIDDMLVQKERNQHQVEQNAKKQSCPNHYLVIKPAFVLTALRNFTEKYLKKEYGPNLGSLEKAIVRSSRIVRPVPRDSVEKFWSNFLQVMPDEKQKLWKTLGHGLDHYLDVLKQREQLDTECEFLRRQNSELRHLLQKHLPSAV